MNKDNARKKAVAFTEPGRCRRLSESAMPPINSAIAIVYTSESKAIMLPGGKRSKNDALYLLFDALPSVKMGDCIILITCLDQSSAEIFEVTSETACAYESYLCSACHDRGWL